MGPRDEAPWWDPDDTSTPPGGAWFHSGSRFGPAGEPEPGFLASNAPATWPRVPDMPDPDDYFLGRVAGTRALAEHVAAFLHACGLQIMDASCDLEVGPGRVRVDLIVRDGRTDYPVFVFPASDAHREGLTFNAIAGLLRDASAFPGPPVYFAPRALPHTRGVTRADIAEGARRFTRLARATGFPGALDAPTAADVVTVLRAVAGVPVEQGGGSRVTAAAAFLGEWLRRRVGGEWVTRSELSRTVLVVRDASGVLQYEVPVFHIVPDGARTGYDGFREALESLEADARTTRRAGVVPSREADVTPDAYRALVLRWLAEVGEDGEHLAVFRACAVCGDEHVGTDPQPSPARTMDDVLDRLVDAVNAPPPRCGCGSAVHDDVLVTYRLQDARPGASLLVTARFTRLFTRLRVQRVR